MRRVVRTAAWMLAGVVLLVAALGCGLMIAGNTAGGRAGIERLTYRLTGGHVKLAGLGGSFPTRLTLGELQLIDPGGVWLTANDVSMHWSPWYLLERRIRIDSLHVARLSVERAPTGDNHGGQASVPDIEVAQFSVPTMQLGASLAGTVTILSLHGGVRLRSLQDANGDLVARRLNGEGDYTLHLRFDPKRMDASLSVHEPASGPLENLLSLPGLGALSATATLQGPRNAEALDVELTAGGLHARVTGSLDSVRETVNFDYSAAAPAMAPRPGVAWAGISLAGYWRGSLAAPQADGRLDAEKLRLGGSIRVAKLAAKLTASSGRVGVRAVLSGVEIPGSQPRFLAADPLNIDASVRLDEAARPLALAVRHPLFSLSGRMDTAPRNAAQLSGSAELRLADLAPYAVFTGQDLRGSGVFSGQLVHRQGNDALSLDASLALTGGTAQWLEFAGPRVVLQLSGSLSDTSLALDRLRLSARAMTLAASGSAERAIAPVASRVGGAAGSPGTGSHSALAGLIKTLQTHWQLEVSDLAALSNALGGNLKMSGRLAGSPDALVIDAAGTSELSVQGSPRGDLQAAVHVRGLPSAPGGTMQVHGMLDGAPLKLDVAVDHGAADTFRMLIREADWKSAHVDGDVTTDASLTQSHGRLDVRVAQLGDLNRFLGVDLLGSAVASVGFVPSQGHTQAQVRVDGKDLVMGSFMGNLHLEALGTPNALGLQMTADMPNVYGAPAQFVAAADLNLGARELRLRSTSLGYHGETLKLLAPSLLSFGKALTIDDLKLGVRDAVFEIRGQLAPAFDLQASVTQVRAALINVFAPGLLASGTIEARARLQGTPSSPTGKVRLDAGGLRLADDAASGLPALDVHGRAQLAGGAAAVNATLGAGENSQLTASGMVPLNAAGTLDLKIGGKLDMGVTNPFLEARGMHATGALTVDAAVTGSLATPQMGGEINLTGGSLRDYGRGVNLSDISAQVVGNNEGSLQIKSFKATAGSGTVGLTGTLGLLRPGLPLDLVLTAKNAQPIASSIVTANLDAEVRVFGTVRRRLDVAGRIHVNRANIGIPNSLPPDVAVLDVRRRGQRAPVDAAKQLIIGMDITIEAPQEILVQGRGLDAEMGGEIHLTGTSDVPVAAGGLRLLRGSFTLAGTKLTFTDESNVSFDGTGLRKKIDPTLDFTARAPLAASTVTLRITGVADAPRFAFSSAPELPQDEIMAQLLFGENAASLTALQAAQIGWALATVSGVGASGSNPLLKLQKSLGLDRLSVASNTTTSATGTTENSGAAIQAGRYISKRVYIEGKQSNTGTSQVQVDVDLTKHLKLQTRLGNGTATTQGTTPENDPGSSIGLSYQFEY